MASPARRDAGLIFYRWLRRCLLGWLILATLASLPASAADIDPARVELGRNLFFDPRLSADNSTSCASCHQVEHGMSDGRAKATGLIHNGVGKVGIRNTPAISNLTFVADRPTFWDGRTANIRLQSTQPITNDIEMGQQTIGQVVNRLARIPGYRQLFFAAFGSAAVTESRMQLALESFERTMVALDTPVDRWLAGDLTATSERVKHGYRVAKASGCFSCHSGSLYADSQFHNCGVSLRSGATIDTGNTRNGQKVFEADRGRGKITGNAGEVRAFKTPTLRELPRTGPYGHDGSFKTLDAAVDHFLAGGVFFADRPPVAGADRIGSVRDPLTDPLLKPVALAAEDRADLLTFLTVGLTSEHFLENITPPKELPR